MENNQKEQRSENQNQEQKRPIQNPSTGEGTGSEKNFGSDRSRENVESGSEQRSDTQRSGSGSTRQ